ncbi:N-acetyltransferase, partial [Mammaliicoccus vitulinus]
YCIDEFNVISKKQGLRIGKKLNNFFKGEIKREDVNKIFLITGGESASKFYSNNKFEITNDGFMMELEL